VDPVDVGPVERSERLRFRARSLDERPLIGRVFHG